MNNLTQTQKDAKQAYLDRQAKQTLAHYQTAGKNQQTAAIKQIDSFLEVVPPDAKRFWLKIRQKMERLAESSK